MNILEFHRHPELTSGSTDNVPRRISQMLSLWEHRIIVTQPSYKIREPIINLRSQICALGNTPQMQDEVSRNLLEIAKVARGSRRLAKTSYVLLKASALTQSQRLVLEQAKCMWLQEKQYQVPKIEINAT